MRNIIIKSMMYCYHQSQKPIQNYKRVVKKMQDTGAPFVPVTEKIRLQNNQMVWLGHDSFLVKMCDLTLLINPFQEREVNIRYKTAKRIIPAISPQWLPDVDIVLYTDEDPDHFSVQSAREVPGNPLFFVPNGWRNQELHSVSQQVKHFFLWENMAYKNLKLVFVPVQSNAPGEEQHTRGGWILEEHTTKKCLYFAGGIKLNNEIKEINKNFDISYAFMPIGGFKPEWFTKNQVLNPELSVQIFSEINSVQMVPAHFGTYDIGYETTSETLDRLTIQWKKANVPFKGLRIFQVGKIEELSI